MGRVRVYIAMSLDGFIAGPDDDLSWLDDAVEPDADPEADGALGFDGFLDDVGALLMGRNTWEVAAAFDGWGYRDLAVLVATNRPLDAPREQVRAVSGTIDALLDQALAAAEGKDVYLDGGVMVRAGLDAGRVDELVVTIVPVVLGAGAPLFAGVAQRHAFRLAAMHRFGGRSAQLRLVRTNPD